LTLVDLESEKRRERRVEQPDGVRKAHLPRELELGAFSVPGGGRRPLADSVHGHQRRVLEGRAEEGRGGVGEVVLGEENLVAWHSDALGDERADPQLVGEPRRHGAAEETRPAWVGPQRGEEDPLELAEGLLEEDHVVEVARFDAGRRQHVTDRVGRKFRVVLLAREALFLDGGYQAAVAQEGGSRVMKEARDPQDVHRDVNTAGGRPVVHSPSAVVPSTAWI